MSVWGGGCGGCLPAEVCVCSGGVSAQGEVYTSPHVDRQTPVKHYLSSTTVAFGNNTQDGKRDSPGRDEYNQIHYILKEFSELNTAL